MHIANWRQPVSNPRKPRICRDFEGRRVFVPCGIERDEMAFARLALDEFEALRLCDLEGLTQEDAGRRMGVSRGTVQRLLSRGRALLVESLVESRALVLGLETDPLPELPSAAARGAPPSGTLELVP